MNKEEILEDFFRTLRVVLTNAFSYSKDHPYFIKSVANFKNKLETALLILNPLKIGVTDSGLMADGRNLDKSGFYDDLARLLHQRKIKSLEIRKGADLQELVQFFSIISLPQKEIFKNGGIGALLLRQQLTHFTIGELDYSTLLRGEGQEGVDIWGYMLRDAVRNNDAGKLNKLADDFGSLVRRVNEKDVFGAEGISSQVSDFMISLRGTNREKFDRCSKDIFLWLLRNKKSLNDEKLAKLRPIFIGLEEDDFSALLWDGILREDNFDSLSLQIFSKISNSEGPGKISGNFLKEGDQARYLRSNPAAVKKIQNLLNAGAEDSLSAVYRNTLESLVKSISFSGKLLFDHKGLLENYRGIILAIFSSGEKNDNPQMIEAILEKEVGAALEDNDAGFLKGLWAQLAKRKAQGFSACLAIEKKLSVSVENIVFSGGMVPEQEFLLEMVSSSEQEPNFYLDKIFSAEKTDKYILSLFLRLFKDDLSAFYARLEQKFQDMEFLLSLIGTLGELSMPATLDILKHIYSSSNHMVKLEVLAAMRSGKNIDRAFLLAQLNSDSILLKRGALLVLILEPQGREEALKLLLNVNSPWGRRNRALIENMQMVYSLGLKEAGTYIKGLAGRRFFWNRRLRQKAGRILKEWNVS
ncbi:hypothetical protein EPN54_01815 [bacterium]|nr:MAG: hypothetical protein EPN54_01815 [bacterium]